ncbi:hypothetical protein LTR70_001391 [Exophiala xenobiotica]|uniref:Protein BIG1 n=1 Tax=Lithohypha guttulata TaxID=1690604 RepID=A0ABR0KMI8_9EURO|nr:hypothetical protein LTR24_000854 [Lithohypha guttulata]KAK5328070.1 hypothetical protein LTR70_001391 [Exophiala xenobiotica]
MYTALLSALALAVSCAYGYENSSPLFIYSTSSLKIDSIPDLASASTIEPILLDSLKSCPTKNYLVVSQPGVSADDFSTSRNTPLLRDRLSMTLPGQTSLQVRDVIDRLDPSVITEHIAKTCSRSTLHIDTTSMIIPDFQGNTQERVFHAEMPALHVNLSPDERHVILLQHDTYLSSMIDTYFKNEDYTLIYATTSVHAQQNSIPASESQEYEAELPVADMMHSGELRRSLAKRKEGLTSNQTVVDGPLFDKYQFLSPGIFMGLFVGLILLSILYVGISALSSLEVTYGAFNKEQGQPSGKKLA